MERMRQPQSMNWGMWLIHKVVHPFTVLAPPVFLLCVIVYLLTNAFSTSIYQGIRSFTGILLPLLAVTFLVIYQKELLERLGNIRPLFSFSVSLIAGFAVMSLVQLLAKFSEVPVVEVVLSGAFSVLVFSYVSVEENRMLSYCYGMMCGFLVYVIFWGFPVYG